MTMTWIYRGPGRPRRSTSAGLKPGRRHRRRPDIKPSSIELVLLAVLGVAAKFFEWSLHHRTVPLRSSFYPHCQVSVLFLSSSFTALCTKPIKLLWLHPCSPDGKQIMRRGRLILVSRLGRIHLRSSFFYHSGQ